MWKGWVKGVAGWMASLRICPEVSLSRRVTDMTDQEFTLATDRKHASVWKLQLGAGCRKPGDRAWSEVKS